jgi:hypothetical protein
MTHNKNTSDTSKAFANYVAEKAIRDLRENKIMSSVVAYELDRAPFIDALRQHVRPEDKELVFALIGSPDRNISYLGVDLLQSIKNEDGEFPPEGESWGKWGMLSYFRSP